jgi:hypothetical protein
MRTTIELEDELFRRAKAHAALMGVSLKTVIEKGVQLALEPAPTKKKPYHVKFPILDKGCKRKGKIPPDIAYRMDMQEDRERYEASLRQ